VIPEPPDEPLPDLGSLQEYFAGRLPDRLHEIEEAWRHVRESAWGAEEAKVFYRLAHSLAGAGGTFGFAAVTDAARALERRLKAVLHQGQEPQEPPVPPMDAAEVDALLAALRRAALPGKA
jgi:HPt (histidine-containing phosphotransfer) domain-containing protein